MKKNYLTIAVVLVIVALSFCGCSTTTTSTTNHHVWNYDMNNLQKVTISLPKSNQSESFILHPDDRQFHFDVPNGPQADIQRWGQSIPLLLSGPMSNRLIYQNAPASQLVTYGLDVPNMIAILTLSDGTLHEVRVGNSNSDGTTYYIRLAENTDVYTVDKSWYDTLTIIITDPPYVAATLGIDVPTVAPAAVAVGNPVTVSVNVTNNGDVGGNFNITLLINGNLQDLQIKTITLASRTSQVVTFTAIENTAGKYVVSTNHQRKVTFTVN